MMKIFYKKNRKGTAVEQKDAKISCYFQKQYYKNVNARKKIEYGMDGLSESF
jgi:hypothetical protein